MRMSGTLWGVTWERRPYGLLVYGLGRDNHLASRKYVGNGSDPVTIRDSVRAFRRDVLGVGR